MFCKSIGMHLATIDTPLEMRNLANIAQKNRKIFKQEVFIDGTNITRNQRENSCFSFLKPLKERVEINDVDCNEVEQKFLCEDVELADTFEDVPESIEEKEEVLDVRATFFKHLGDYGDLVVF
jgi:hypothetical protein